MTNRAAAVLATALLVGCGSRSREPIYTVSRTAFVHRVTAEGTLEAREATKISVAPTVTSRVRLAWIAAEGTRVEEGDLIARFDREDFERRLEEARAELDSAGFRTQETRADNDRKLQEHKRDFEIADLELGFARRYQKEDAQIFSRHEIAESEIDEELANARRQHADEMTSAQHELAQTELDILAIEKRKANLRIDEAEAGLESLEVRAPHAGILTLVRNWRGEPPAVGAEMWRGQEIAEIPALAEVQAEVFVLEADARGLVEGRRAQVVVAAHPEVLHEGRISRVDALAQPRFGDSPVQYFGVIVELDVTHPDTMKPGQRVSATLFLEELDEALVVPRQAIHQRGDRTWVYRRNGSGFEVCDVVIGPSSVGLVVITEGLEDGDVVALVEPVGVEPPDVLEAEEV